MTNNDLRGDDALVARLRKFAKFVDDSDIVLVPTLKAEDQQILDDVRSAADMIDSLRAQLENERMRLAACGVAALANTESTVAQRIRPDNPYYSASYGDVCRAVDREMDLRARLATAERDAERYRWLRANRPVMLLTGFFGNGCVNREVAEIDAAIDTARSANG